MSLNIESNRTKKIFLFLVGINLILLLSLLGLSIFKKEQTVLVQPVRKELIEIIKREVNDFGLPDKEFIVLKDTLTLQFDSIPNDFPVHYFIYEIQKELVGSENYITGIETEINLKTGFIITDEKQPIKIKFNFSNGTKENSKEVVLFVKKMTSDEDSFISTIESLPFPVTVILTPSVKERVFAKILAEHSINFGVFITPSITEELYKISETYSPQRIRQTINRLAIDFERSNNFLIETSAASYRSATYDQIRKRIIASNKPVFLADTLINLSAYSQDEVLERVKKILLSVKPGKQEIILFPFENLDLISALIPTLSKRSIRIANLSY